MGFLRAYNLACGIGCIALGVVLAAGAVFMPVAAIGLGVGALGCFASGGFCLWWHFFTKDTILAQPMSFGAGFSSMAAGTAQANTMLATMVAQSSGAVATSINGQQVMPPSGTAARGQVKQCVELGTEPNGNVAVDLTLTVTGTAYAPYDAHVRASLSPVGRSQVHVNGDVPVIVDPTNPHAVSLNLPVW